MCRRPLRAPTPLQFILWPIIDPILVTFGKICNFRDPNLVTFYFYELTHFFRLNEEHFNFHLQYKHPGTSVLTVNMKNCLTPKNSKMCHPILVTLLKMRPHCSQSSREKKTTPFSGTSPLTSYKEVPPPPGGAMDLNNSKEHLYIASQHTNVFQELSVKLQMTQINFENCHAKQFSN